MKNFGRAGVKERGIGSSGVISLINKAVDRAEKARNEYHQAVKAVDTLRDHCAELYYTAEPILSDSEYDRLVEIVERLRS